MTELARLREALEALEAMLKHSCVADSDPKDKDSEDHDAERLARRSITTLRAALAVPASAARPEVEAEAFIQAAVDSSPEPLRRLGEWLTHKLDNDDWKTAERMLLGATLAVPTGGEAERLPGPDYQLDRVFIGAGEYVRWDQAVATVMRLQKELYAMDAKLTSPVPQPDASRFFWVIERTDADTWSGPKGAPLYVGEWSSKQWHGNTRDIGHALKFASREDAEAFVRDHLNSDPAFKVAEHGWLAAPQADVESMREATIKVGSAALDIAEERWRQVKEEGWTPEHDDTHASGEMAMAAACYTLTSFLDTEHSRRTTFTRYWPWSEKWWKPKGGRRDLVRAGALIIAEIERLDRRALSGEKEGNNG